MRDHKQSTGRAKRAIASRAERPQPELPAWKAFVVQFNRDTDPEAAIFGGRVEHLSSGRRARFESTNDLIAALQRLLGEVAGADAPQHDEGS